jgi:hypothetical protein
VSAHGILICVVEGLVQMWVVRGFRGTGIIS